MCKGLYKFIVFILLLISYYIEILLFALQIFPFIQLKDVAYLSQFYFNSPAIYQILGFSSIILFIIIFYIIKEIFAPKFASSKKNYFILIGFIALIFTINTFASNNKWMKSQSYFFFKNKENTLLKVTGNKLITNISTNSASKSLFQEVRSNN